VWLVALLGGIRGTVFAAVAVAALAFCGVQSARLQSARDTIAVRDTTIADLRAETATLRGANHSNSATIHNLRAANAELADAARADQAEAERVAARLERERDRLHGELLVERKRRADIYQGDDYAKRWAETAVPAAVADRLLRDTEALRTDRPD
jgi:hypothetical protein